MLTHKRPVTRRDFLAQGFSSGLATIAAPTVFSLFADPRAAQAALSPDLIALKASCGLDVAGAGKIPFICIDLAGGANMVGSNVLAARHAVAIDERRLGFPATLWEGVEVANQRPHCQP